MVEITFNGNNGTPALTNFNYEAGQPFGWLPHATREDRAFSGWFTTAIGGGNVQITTASIVPNEPTEYFARWPAGYPLDFNSGTPLVPNPPRQYWGVNLPYGPLPNLAGQRPGFLFMGWRTLANGGGNLVTENTLGPSSIPSPSTITLHAWWEPFVCAITFDFNNADTPGNPVSVTASNGAAMPSINYLGSASPTRAGHVFNGYWDQPADGTQYYNNNRLGLRNWDKETASATLYAQWLRETLVTFDFLGGGGGSTPATVLMVESLPLPQITGQAPTKTGHFFGGWYDDPDWTQGVLYYRSNLSPNRQSWDKDVAFATLYARWNPNFKDIEFNVNHPNAVGAAPTPKTAHYQQPMPSIAAHWPPPAVVGHNFTGWFGGTANNPGTRYYNADYTSATAWDDSGLTGTVTLHAQWALKVCEITFDNGANVSGGPTGVVHVAYGAKMPSFDCKTKPPERSGFDFDGYYEFPNGGGLCYYDVELKPQQENWWQDANLATLWAHWIPKTRALRFVAFDYAGTLPTNAIQIAGEPLPDISGNPPITRVGRLFDGWWSATQKYYHADYSPASPVWDDAEEGGVVALYADWTFKTCEITFTNSVENATGGETGTVYAVYNANVPNLRPGTMAPARTGYHFTGYYEFPDGAGVMYYDKNLMPQGQWLQDATNATLWAGWELKVCEITFDNGSEKTAGGPGAPIFVAYGADLPQLENGATPPVLEGCTFYGYYEFPDGEGECYYDAGLAPLGVWDRDVVDATLHAWWVCGVEMRLDFNHGGMPLSEPVLVGLGDLYFDHLPAPPVRSGHVFQGWWLEDARIWTSSMVNAPASHVLTARWAPANPGGLRIIGIYFTVENNVDMIEIHVEGCVDIGRANWLVGSETLDAGSFVEVEDLLPYHPADDEIFGDEGVPPDNPGGAHVFVFPHPGTPRHFYKIIATP